MRGYCGAAAVDAAGALLGVSCPRGGVAVFWDLATAAVVGTVALSDGCGLAPAEAPGAFFLTSGRGGAVHVDLRGGRMTPLSTPFVAAARWDNHVTRTVQRVPAAA